MTKQETIEKLQCELCKKNRIIEELGTLLYSTAIKMDEYSNEIFKKYEELKEQEGTTNEEVHTKKRCCND